MSDLQAAARRRWSNLLELPTVHVSSGRSTWPGFEFQEIEIPRYGTFERGTSSSHVTLVVHILGPLKVRYGPPSRPFQDRPTYPTIPRFGDGDFGAWEGAQRGRHLFVESGAFERVTHQPFRRDAMRLLDGPNPAIEQLLCALRLDTVRGHPTGATLGEHVIASILHQIILQSGTAFAAERIGYLPQNRIRRVYETIEEELGGSLTLERLAASVGLSVRHLCRSFRASTGLSLHQYIVARRVNRARLLIEKSELGLDEIAETVGFAHHSHMAAAFRRTIGATPAQFRTRSPDSRT
jgi:AraC family transcriptional regulator